MKIAFFVTYRSRSSVYRSSLTGVLALAIAGCSSGSGDNASGGSGGNVSMTAGGATASGGATSSGGA
ncbi:MAG TPA: hypothetical protein VGP93_13340, partial [Polyangiaceae bacterium]|nr:hypothetical protein [Polyangiaceae bacterium]